MPMFPFLRYPLHVGVVPLVLGVWSLAWLSATALAADGEVLIHQKLPGEMVLMEVDGELGGKACHMVVDTGAEFTAVDRSLKDQAGEKITEANMHDANGNEFLSGVYYFANLRIQSFAVEKFRGAVIDLEPIKQRFGRQMNAVLGWSELKAGKLFVNRDEGVWELHTGPWKLPDADSVEGALESDAPDPTFEAEIGGQRGSFYIDTGSNWTIDLPEKMFEALVATDFIEMSPAKGQSFAAGGKGSLTYGWFLKGKFMGRELKGISVSALPEEKGGTGRIGMAWLRGFNFEIDGAKNQWRYQLRPQAVMQLASDFMLGGELAFEQGGTRVKDVGTERNSALRKAGLQVGDVIRRFDTVPGDQLSFGAINEIMASEAGQVVHVRYTRGPDGKETGAVLQLPEPVREGQFVGRERDKVSGPEMSKAQETLAVFQRLLKAEQLLRSAAVLCVGGEAAPLMRLRLKVALGLGDVYIEAKLPSAAAMVGFDAEVGGQKGTMLLNLSSQYTVIDKSIGSALGGKETSDTLTNANGNDSQQELYELPELRVQFLVAKDSKVIALDFSPFRKFTGYRIIGSLGVADLSETKVLLNFGDNLLKAHSGSWMIEGPTCQEAELEDYRTTPVYETSIENRHAEFGFNTSEGVITLDKALFSTLVSNRSIEVSRDSKDSGWFVKGELMGKNLRGMQVNSMETGDGLSYLGVYWLRGFDVELDLHGHRWRYELRKEARPPLATYLMIGGTFSFPGDGARLESITAGGAGAAEKAGMEVGDVIQVFGPLRGEALSSVTMAELITEKAGQSIAVQYRRHADGKETTTSVRIQPAISQWDFPGRDLFGAEKAGQ